MKRSSTATALVLAVEQPLKEVAPNSMASNLVPIAEGLDPLLCDSRNLKDPELRKLWIFADNYFSGIAHGDRSISAVTREEAGRMLRNALEDVKEGRPIQDARLDRYCR